MRTKKIELDREFLRALSFIFFWIKTLKSKTSILGKVDVNNSLLPLCKVADQHAFSQLAAEPVLVTET